MQFNLILSAITAIALATPLQKRELTVTATLTTRDHKCITSKNTDCKATAGGSVDPGAEGGKTQCGGSALAENIVGLDGALFFVGGQDLGTGINDARSRCGKDVTITLNGKSKIVTVADRVTPGTGVGGPQIDVSPDIADFFGLSAATNTLTQTGVKISFQ